jgi:hypothetical protein
LLSVIHLIQPGWSCFYSSTSPFTSSPDQEGRKEEKRKTQGSTSEIKDAFLHEDIWSGGSRTGGCGLSTSRAPKVDSLSNEDP